MPTITRAFIKAGMVFFLISLLLLLLHAAAPVLWPTIPLPPLMPAFWHMLMLGWITQIIMGVSLWMFPKRSRENPRGNQTLAWIAFWALNVGLTFRIAGEPWLGRRFQTFFSMMLVLSVILQLGGGFSYVWLIWPRVKGKRKRRKKQQSSG